MRRDEGKEGRGENDGRVHVSNMVGIAVLEKLCGKVKLYREVSKRGTKKSSQKRSDGGREETGRDEVYIRAQQRSTLKFRIEKL